MIDLRCGDCLDVLPTLDAGSVQMCVTSPPYWGLRDYGIPGQLGLEATPDEYVAKLVTIFREVRRVLRADGTLWLNLGDSYYGDSPPRRSSAGAFSKEWNPADSAGNGGLRRSAARCGDLKPKDLCGIPWMVAFALRADGWYLRSDIIWHKPNCMPESVEDRPTRAHEYLFLLAKAGRYYYDAEAVKEPALQPIGEARFVAQHKQAQLGANQTGTLGTNQGAPTRNKRSVWTVNTTAYKGAHFATFPPALIGPCILAGSKPGDVVLDPFGGSGTTAEVALKLGRSAVTIELNPAYVELERERIAKVQPVMIP